MSLPRFFAAPGVELVAGAAVPVEAGELHHARVRRLLEGRRVALLDGRGAVGEGILSGGAVHLDEVRQGAGESLARASVLLSCAEPQRLEWAVEKGTECGAAAFVLVSADRSQASHVRAAEARLPRLTRIAREAVKQCGRSNVPALTGPLPLAAAAVAAPRPLYLASVRAGLDEAVQPVTAQAFSLAIGPEGGFTEAEERALFEAGARPLGLGPRTLRLETAVVAALALLLRGG